MRANVEWTGLFKSGLHNVLKVDGYMSFLKRIFRSKKTPPIEQVPTAPLDPRSAIGISAIAKTHMLVGAAHSAGRGQSQDDDSFLVLTSGAEGDKGLLDFGLFCVADGFGESERGHIASAIAIRTVAHDLTRDAFLRIFETEPSEEPMLLDELVRKSFEEANRAVLSRGAGGTTALTAALVLGDRMVIGHVGNTRAYTILGEKVECLTCDPALDRPHDEAGEVIERGGNPMNPHHDLLNALGKTEEIKVDIASYAVLSGSRLLLCSDGLWSVVPDDKIRDVVTGPGSPQTTCEKLIETAKETGAKDSITVVQVIFPFELI